MALFSRRANVAAVSPQPEVTVAAAAGTYTGNGSGENSIGHYYSYIQGDLRNKCMQTGTISRGRDLLASVVGSTGLEMYKCYWDDTKKEMVEEEIAPRSWLKQPDPQLSYSAAMSWLLDDLLFFGRAFWWISSRTADGFPASFTRLPAAMVNTLDMTGPVFAFGTSKQIYFQGAEIPWEDVIQFISPIQGIIYQSPQIVETALKLQANRLLNANTSIPSGILKQSSGEPLDAASLGQLAESFNQARLNNQVAALNQYVDYIETKSDPSKMLLMEAAEFQAKELARLCNIPFFLAGLDVGAYSYNSNKGAREDLYVFGARPYMQCIQETLSMNNVLPNGTYVRFDIDDYLAEAIGEEEGDISEMPDMTTPNQTPTGEMQ
jgi:hypothetical protein